VETIQVGNAPTAVRSPAIATASGNTFVCLVRFALANIRRRPERFVLSVLGIALAIACVTVVRTISASFAITGADSVTRHACFRESQTSTATRCHCGAATK
jgi:putative ABC transport system permease protein